MNEIIGGWVRSIAAAALISSVALAITPKGKVQRVLKAICGVLVIIAVISPIANGSVSEISLDLAQYRASADKIVGNAETANMNLSRTIIEQDLEEYILDKAKEMGAPDLQVDISSVWSDDGYWYPYQVTLTGEVNAPNRSKLSAVIESELGIPIERQNWNGYEGD